MHRLSLHCAPDHGAGLTPRAWISRPRRCGHTPLGSTTTPYSHTSVRFRRAAAGVAIAAVGIAGAPAAVALDVPSRPGALLPQAASPSVTEPTEPARLRILKEGLSGADVTALQKQLASRRIKVTVDGEYGPGTRKAVRIQQRRFNVRANGVASVGFQKRLGLTPSFRGVASQATVGARYLREFPVLGKYTYIDDYGFPRPQGRHDGNDLIAPKGTPVVAVADGTIQRVTPIETSRGGISIWQLDEQGNTFFFAHLAGIVKGISAGTPVRVGQKIGTVGDTGDARGGVHHLHFEIHPGDGPSINPFTELQALDPNIDPLRASLSRGAR